jgi:hypothetical protein
MSSSRERSPYCDVTHAHRNHQQRAEKCVRRHWMGTELRHLKYRLEREVASVTMIQIDQRHPLLLPITRSPSEVIAMERVSCRPANIRLINRRLSLKRRFRD